MYEKQNKKIIGPIVLAAPLYKGVAKQIYISTHTYIYKEI